MDENEVVVPAMNEQEEAYWAGDGEWSEYEAEQTSDAENNAPAEMTEELQEEPAGVESAEAEGVQTENAAGSAAQDSFELVYNGERLNRSREEVITLAQKGLNYDHGVERARREGAAMHQKTIDELSRIADRMGQSTDGLLVWVEQQMHRNAVDELVDTGLSQATAEELVELREEKRAQQAQQQREQQKSEAQADTLKPWKEFWSKYPKEAAEYQEKGAPQAFVEAVNNGTHPVAAQAMVENANLKELVKQLQANVEALRQGQTNKKAAPTAVGSFGGKKEEDPFMRGFLAE